MRTKTRLFHKAGATPACEAIYINLSAFAGLQYGSQRKGQKSKSKELIDMNNTGIKRNKAMRLASALMVLALLTVCAVSGTFAKYVTSAEGTDTARVAKWGFTTTSLDLSDLFKQTYDNTVSAAADAIAPGTTGSDTFEFVFGGQAGIDAPEVDYAFTVDTDGSTVGDNIKTNTNILWKLDDGSFGTWDELIASIKALSGDATGTKTYKAGNLPTEFPAAGKAHTVTWKWVFFDESTASTTGNDTIDTGMGNATSLENVTLKIKISATQVD